MGLEEALEPEEDGLLISTGREDKHFGRLFLWYVGRPRSIGSSEIYFHHPFVHQDRILALAGPARLAGVYSSDQALQEFFTGEAWFGALNCAVSHGGIVYASRDAERGIADEELYQGGFFPSDVVRIARPHIAEPVLQTDKVIVNMASDGRNLYFLEARPRSFMPDYEISRWDGKEKVTLASKTDLQRFPDISSLALADDGFVLGSVGVVEMIPDPKVISSTEYGLFNVHEAYAACCFFKKKAVEQQESSEHLIPRTLHEAIDDVARRHGFVTEYDIPELASLEDLGYFFKKNFRIDHVLPFRGKILYSRKNKLYVSSNSLTPVWSFRHPITGLASVPFDLLKDIKGKASVRKGRAKQKSSFARSRIAA